MNVRPSEYPLCRQTKTNGRLCQSPARGASAFCHFHQKHPRARTFSAGPGFSTNVLYPLRNARSIQQALAMVFTGLAGSRIAPKTAGKMIFALQTAGTNVSKYQRNEDFSDNPNG